MQTRYKYLAIVISFCSFILLLLTIRSHQITSVRLLTSVDSSRRSIVYRNFSCETWRNLTFINESEYQQCLGWGSDGSFWDVDSIRHTAHVGLLNASSIIVEVGGNRGHDTIKFIQLYDPFIISYEPLVQMWKSLVDEYKNNSKVEFLPYGLGSHARSVLIEPADAGNAGTSIFRPLSSPNSTLIQEIHLLNIVQVINTIRQTRTRTGVIDMISINCEGCEFEILPALIVNGMLKYFRIIQFASHISLVPDSSCIYCQIEQALKMTHQVKYHYSKLWEGWTLKEILDK